MNLPKTIVFTLILLLLMPFSLAATISGTVYDLSFNKISSATITINTTPTQTKVLENGDYKFTVPLGSYLIQAKQYNYDKIIGEINQTIKVTTDGEFILDLIVFPKEDFNNLDLLDFNQENELISKTNENKSNTIIIFLIIILLIMASSLLYLFIKKTNKLNETNKENDVPINEDDLEKNILAFIQAEKTTTQLIIRNKFPQYSEAKISIIIKKLESEQKIKKIKHGRANIISLNK